MIEEQTLLPHFQGIEDEELIRSLLKPVRTLCETRLHPGSTYVRVLWNRERNQWVVVRAYEIVEGDCIHEQCVSRMATPNKYFVDRFLRVSGAEAWADKVLIKARPDLLDALKSHKVSTSLNGVTCCEPQMVVKYPVGRFGVKRYFCVACGTDWY